MQIGNTIQSNVGDVGDGVCDLGLFSHTIKFYVCRRCRRLFRSPTSPTCFNIHSIGKLSG